MLTTYQSEKVAIAQKLLNEVQSEIAEEDIYKAMLLGAAANACDQALHTEEDAWYSPEKIKSTLPTPSTGERILKVLGYIAGTSALSCALCACLSLGAFGLSEFKAASGWTDSNNYAAECRGYRGLTFAFLSVTLICGVLGSVVGEIDNRSQY